MHLNHPLSVRSIKLGRRRSFSSLTISLINSLAFDGPYLHACGAVRCMHVSACVRACVHAVRTVRAVCVYVRCVCARCVCAVVRAFGCILFQRVPFPSGTLK